MVALTLFLTCLFVAVAVGALAAYSDWKGMTIPNWHSAAIIGAFIAAFVFVNLFDQGMFSTFMSHLIAAVVMFVITAGLFAMRVIGAGDSKLGTAYALWVGVAGLPAFLFYMALIGGLLGVVALLLRKYKPVPAPKEGSWVAQAQAGASKVPYGIAIFSGALASFVKLGYFSPQVFSTFF